MINGRSVTSKVLIAFQIKFFFVLQNGLDHEPYSKFYFIIEKRDKLDNYPWDTVEMRFVIKYKPK